MNEPTVFLSHSHKDRKFVERLAHDLHNAGIKVWYDQWELEIGHSLTIKIQEGIDRSQYLAIVLSQDAVESEWVKREWTAAFRKELENRRIGILPILYKPCEIPSLLRDKVYADFRNQSRYDEKLKDLIHSLKGLPKKPVPSSELVKKSEDYPRLVKVSFQGDLQIRKGNALEIYRWLGSEGSSGRITIGSMRDPTDDIEYRRPFPMMTILPVDITFRGRVKGNIVKNGSQTEFDLETTEEEYQKYYPHREVKRSPLVR